MVFSVLVSLFNKADVVRRTLISVARQTFSDYELIVVDDGSTDDSYKVVDEFRKSELWQKTGRRLILIRQDNLGASAARNRGAKESRGRFLAMLDGDDEWLPHHLVDLYAVIQKHPFAKVLSTNSVSTDNGKVGIERCGYGRPRITSFNVFDFPYGLYPMNSDTIAVDRNVFFQVGGYDERFAYYEDREFYYRLAECVGDFFVNWRVSACYHHDAARSAHTLRRHNYLEYGFLVATEELLATAGASMRRERCVRETVKMLALYNAVKGRGDAVRELIESFPLLSASLPIIVSDGCKHCGCLQKCRMSLQWFFIRVKSFVQRKTYKYIHMAPLFGMS